MITSASSKLGRLAAAERAVVPTPMVPTIADGAAAVLDFFRSRGEPLPRWQAQVLDRGGRVVVVEYALFSGAEPRGTIIVKGYRDEAGVRTHATMCALRRALQRASAPRLAIPAPLFYDAARRCLGQERVEGTPLRELSERPDAPRFFELAGCALAELHSLPVEVGAPEWLADQLAALSDPAAIAWTLPQHGQRIAALMRRMTELEERWRDEIVPAPAHRDFHWGQLFFDAGRVWVIDWDFFACADPALDVGNFLMYSETYAGARSAELGAAFLAGYFRDRPEALRRRIPLYQALNYLRRACKHHRSRDPDSPARVAVALERVERCLAQA